jgi:alpha-beta hydrolase superfamily lysophospholipase
MPVGDDLVFGLLHPPTGQHADEPIDSDGISSSPSSKTAVLICPPFGWDDICSYRSRRAWAEYLAANGHTALRIDLPSTGDSSGSPGDPARLGTWTEAVTVAAGRLSSIADCQHVAAIGIGLGGLLVCNAISSGAPIDEAVLWATPARGRTFLRELRAFSHLEDPEFDAPSENSSQPSDQSQSELESAHPDTAHPDGYTGAGGFLISSQTASDLQELDLTSSMTPPDQLRRAMLLGRDSIPPDPRLKAHLERVGVEVTTAPGTGYGEMMAKPHLARAPIEIFTLVEEWLQKGAQAQSQPVAGGPAQPPDASYRRAIVQSEDDSKPSTIELVVANGSIRELPLRIAQPFGELFGILCVPTGLTEKEGLCVVLLNAGAIRHTGPNRMWVEAARRWAARGVPTLRLDLEGIGDADGDGEQHADLSKLYVPRYIDQVCSALDALQARGLGTRFLLAGLCSGAYWSFHAAIRDKRVIAAIMLNPRTLFFDPATQIARNFRRGVLRRSSWRRILQGEVPLSQILDFAYHAPFVLPRRRLASWRARRSGGDELDHALDDLCDQGKRVRLIFTENEPLREELEAEDRLDRPDRWPNVTVDFIPGRIHTLRPFASQRAAHEAFDRALERELRAISHTYPNRSSNSLDPKGVAS